MNKFNIFLVKRILKILFAVFEIPSFLNELLFEYCETQKLKEAVKVLSFFFYGLGSHKITTSFVIR